VSRMDSPPHCADEAARHAAALGGAVVIDCADGVGGAAELGALITDRLRADRTRVTVVDDDRLLRAAATGVGRDRPARIGPVASAASWLASTWPWLGGTVAAAATVAAVVLVGDPSPRPQATLLIEGKVVMEVPEAWTARRITMGPGSARVQVTSPSDTHTALHLTQASVGNGETLVRTAEVLRNAMLAEPPGVFADFDGADTKAGRPAVTYREIRDGHDIMWTVVLDPGVRISIGCQSARGSEEAVRPACERAIASARGIDDFVGTVARQSESNNT
jgi:type VII secretion-associated protein (TIGR03931 family)